jgi:RNase P subunit RPR2
MKYIDLKTAVSLLKLMGVNLDIHMLEYCPKTNSHCEHCQTPFLHVNFHIEDNRLYATSKCEKCGVKDRPNHIVHEWIHR